MGIPGQIGLSLPYVVDLINPERRSVTCTTLLVLTCMRYPLIKKEDTHGYTRQSSLVARVGRVFGHLPGALPSPGGRGRLGALPDRVAHRIAQQELRHYGGGRPRDQGAAVAGVSHQQAVG